MVDHFHRPRGDTNAHQVESCNDLISFIKLIR
jgi:hypothetical protein